MITLTTTRFTNETFLENEEYRLIHQGIACIYGSPQPMAPFIDPKSPVFVVEMNNSTNEILGVGLIRNQHVTNRRMIVYSKGNYNRYIFKGSYRIDVNEMPSEIVQILNVLLFTGKTHLKRGSGFTTITPKLLRHPVCNELDLKVEIYNIFKNKYNAISMT